jgi:protein-S-isoprenylcysteine O-methyltransferase Ste14
MNLLAQMLLRFFVMAALILLLLFAPAGTFHYWQAWSYFALIFFVTFAIFIYIYLHDKDLLKRRMESREKLSAQKWLMNLMYLFWPLAMMLPGLDHRFAWSHLPAWLSVVSLLVVLSGYLFVFWVVNTNRFAARTIRVEQGQQLISTGPYAIVRHPMYLGMLGIFLCTPLALGSLYAVPIFALFIPIIVVRLMSEEKLLLAELPGYVDYCSKTRCRLIPLIW